MNIIHFLEEKKPCNNGVNNDPVNSVAITLFIYQFIYH